ncbi:hypothetical protein BDN72DRAFT_132692 [Pluteus cervinus]|uniref:Uncharacterized protein n=1 Tax=Pluteus cervinus TaxID=181527 RepID=A0ACD3ALN0_9AGAR|nr:hypothetical protein BDN72DRAFT_132692 [Pluteus cervinus]
MHPARPPHSPTGTRSRHRTSPPRLDPPQPSSSQTSLPSIRQLQLYSAAPTGMSQHLPTGGDGSGYYTSSPTHYPSHLTQHDTVIPHLPGSQRLDPYAGGGSTHARDSEADEVEQQGPPKKKRRRQALSCTECKRRKIKCDRAQPCAPCTRRGEQSKCQWHIVEPIEKYVMRSEYDELKARFDNLETLVKSLLPPTAPPAQPTMSMPYYQMGMQPGMSGAAVEAVSPYHTGTPGPIVYQSMMGPPQAYGLDAPGTPQRFPKHEESNTTSRHHPGSAAVVAAGLGGTPPATTSTTSPVMTPGAQSPSMSRMRPLDNKSPTSAVKNSALSLQAITSPYNPDSSQQKNFNAQTLTLGERLRLVHPKPSSSSSSNINNNSSYIIHEDPVVDLSCAKVIHIIRTILIILITILLILPLPRRLRQVLLQPLQVWEWQPPTQQICTWTVHLQVPRLRHFN